MATARAGSPVTVYFDSSHQGGSGNQGQAFRPIDDLGFRSITVTARTSIAPFDPFDPFAPGTAGTIYVGSNGGGVKDIGGLGSSQISGINEDSIEELIVSFDRPVSTESLSVTISKYKPGSGFGSNDDPLVFVFLTSGEVLMFDETNGIVDESGDMGTLDLATLLAPDAIVKSIRVRELRRHIALDSITFVAVPTPGCLALLAAAGLIAPHRRRRRVTA